MPCLKAINTDHSLWIPQEKKKPNKQKHGYQHLITDIAKSQFYAASFWARAGTQTPRKAQTPHKMPVLLKGLDHVLNLFYYHCSIWQCYQQQTAEQLKFNIYRFWDTVHNCQRPQLPGISNLDSECRIIESFWLEKSSQIIKSSHELSTAKYILNHVPRHHIYTSSKYCQGWWMNHSLGQPAPMLFFSG